MVNEHHKFTLKCVNVTTCDLYIYFFLLLSISTHFCTRKVPLHRIHDSFMPYQWDLKQAIIDSRVSARKLRCRNNRNSNHSSLWLFPVCLVLFLTASTRGLNSRMETNRSLASNKDRTRKRRKRESGKRESYVHCRQWDETKARRAKTEIKGRKKKIRHIPQRATEHNDAANDALESGMNRACCGINSRVLEQSRCCLRSELYAAMFLDIAGKENERCSRRM